MLSVRPILIACLGLPLLLAAETPLQTYRDLDHQIDTLREQERVIEHLLGLWAEQLPGGTSPELDAARAAVEKLEAQQEAWRSDPALASAQDDWNAAYGEKTRITHEQLMASYAPFVAAREELAALQERLDDRLAGIAGLEREQALALAADHRRAGHLSRALEVATWRIWHTPRAKALFTEQEARQAAADKVLKQKPKRDKQARRAHKDARKALEQAEAAAVAAWPAAAWAIAELQDLEQRQEALEAQKKTLQQQALEEGATRIRVSYPMPPRKGKEQDPSHAELWLPPGITTVRGLVVGHPPDLGTKVASTTQVRFVAAAHGLGVLTFKEFDAIFDYGKKQAGERFQQVLDQCAEKTGHPEISNVPFLSVGHSTSGIFARNMAYWQPDRCLGVIHIKSGNMHQHRPDPERSLAGVPFLAINGEYEEYGPEGGIRAEFDKQTQWVMIREQLLRRRQQDIDHLMSLVVHQGAGHGGWNDELSLICATFVDKAATYRLPENPGDGVQTCKPLTNADGWLTDADLKKPAHEPAPAASYAGDPKEAFWHFDEDMARAVYDYHQEGFFSPDPTWTDPVPTDWP